MKCFQPHTNQDGSKAASGRIPLVILHSLAIISECLAGPLQCVEGGGAVVFPAVVPGSSWPPEAKSLWVLTSEAADVLLAPIAVCV